MSSDPYSANLRLEVEMLRLQVSELKDTVKMLWQERTPRILSSNNTLRMVLGKTDAAITKGSSGTVSIWTGTAGSESDSTENITVYNKIGNIAITKWCICAYFNNAWYLVAGECA
jgi:hypothetical protein